jgi:hypothetical protein
MAKVTEWYRTVLFNVFFFSEALAKKLAEVILAISRLAKVKKR